MRDKLSNYSVASVEADRLEINVKNLLLRDWSVVRTIRLLMGLGLVIFGVTTKDNGVFALIGAVFAIQAILKLSYCCGGSACDSGVGRTKQEASDEDDR